MKSANRIPFFQVILLPFQKVHSRRGFTLIEVLVAILILGIGSALLVRMMSAGFPLERHGENLTLATLLAQEKMEEIYKDSKNLLAKDDEGVGEGVYSRFRWKREFTAVSGDKAGLPGERQADLREVKVTVFWKQRRVTRSLQFVSYVNSPKKE